MCASAAFVCQTHAGGGLATAYYVFCQQQLQVPDMFVMKAQMVLFKWILYSDLTFHLCGGVVVVKEKQLLHRRNGATG